MRVYISSDIEGVSGVVNSTHTTPSGSNYSRARKLMTDEVNAAIRGALSAGATEIVVNDSHGPMTNLLVEELMEEAELITGNLKGMGMMEELEPGFDAVMLLGYHSRHNTPGVLAHTYYSSVISEVRVNGKAVGEFEFNSMIAGHYGVPVVFVSGDDVLQSQVREYDNGIEALAVKKAISRHTARCIQPGKVHRLIEEGTRRALTENISKVKPSKVEGQVELQVSFLNSGMADAAAIMPGAFLESPNCVKFVAADIVEAYRARAALTTLGASVL
ncbi:MAG: M55 family metallopeptidase [Sphaerochaetaceae bacterium]